LQESVLVGHIPTSRLVEAVQRLPPPLVQLEVQMRGCLT